MIPYGRQTIEDDDVKTVAETLKSDFLTSGPKVKEFEDAICEYDGSKYCVAVNSGTSALDIAVSALNLPAGSEIITTPFTFVATSNSILYNNCKPIFADIDPKTYNISPEEIKKKITKKTKAIIYVDYAGQPCKIDEIKEIAEKHNLYLIEDAAHSLGAEYKGKKVGTFADLTTFSFHPVKLITTGEGGAVVTNNEKLAEKMRLLRNHGIDKTPAERESYLYDMKMLGRNYRITDFQCALGIRQLGKIERFIKRRQQIADAYNRELVKITGVSIPYVMPNVRHAWHLYTILLDKGIDRDKFFVKMRECGIGVNVHYIPTYKFTYYKSHGILSEGLPVTEEVFSRIISLPLFPTMKDSEIQSVMKAVKKSIA